MDETRASKEKVEIKNKNAENSFFDLRTGKGQVLFASLTVLVCVLIQLVPYDQLRELLKEKKCENLREKCVTERKPTFWIYGKGGDGQWTHVIAVLQRLGYERVYENDSTTADLLWAHDYPFNKLTSQILSMSAHQKVNHLPGCGFLTNKVDLATSNLKYIPKAFRLPQDQEEFLKFSSQNSDKLFVVKHYQHRHIKIQPISAINFSNNETFIQEFIDRPLLVDGHKFDIGVYTIITSIDPLRVYIYSGDVLFRYCPQKYHPFDPENLDKYVVGDDYLPTWEVPSLARYYNALGLGMRGSFDAYMRSHDRDPAIIWQQVEDAIRTAILGKHPLLRDLARHYKNKQNFFEMARFDLIIDEDLQVYLIEANMSPNLSSAHFKQNTLLYEQVIYNLMNLVGIGSYSRRKSLKKFDGSTEAMLSNDKNVMVRGDICGQLPCSETCSPIECRLCKPCLSRMEISELHRAYREHLNRGDTKRIFPVPIERGKLVKGELSEENRLISEWFREKCEENQSWCS